MVFLHHGDGFGEFHFDLREKTFIETLRAAIGPFHAAIRRAQPVICDKNKLAGKAAFKRDAVDALFECFQMLRRQHDGDALFVLAHIKGGGDNAFDFFQRKSVCHLRQQLVGDAHRQLGRGNHGFHLAAVFCGNQAFQLRHQRVQQFLRLQFLRGARLGGGVLLALRIGLRFRQHQLFLAVADSGFFRRGGGLVEIVCVEQKLFHFAVVFSR